MNNIDEIVMKTFEDMKLNRINDNLYLSNKQIEVLKKYEIDYNKDIDSLIYEIEDILNDSYEELFDLEELSRELSEFNYYHNTKK